MKNLILSLVLAIGTIYTLPAQILEDTRVMNAGTQPALTMVLPGADSKFVDSEWKDYMKPYGRISRVKKAKEVVAEGVQILDVGGINRLNIYSMSEPVAEGAKLIVWIDMGGAFLSSSAFPNEYPGTIKFLQGFAHQVEVNLIDIDLDNQRKQLGKFESNLSKLQRENDNLHKTIEDAKKRIAEAEEEIVKNLQEQEMAQKEIEAQQDLVNEVQKNLEKVKARKPN